MEKVFLIILDGFGIRKQRRGNAVKLARMPFYNSLLKKHPHSMLKTDSQHVGLPKHTLGGSEVGHMNMGAGRVAKQMLTIINDSLDNKSFYKKKVFTDAIKHVKKKKTRLHILGMVSDAGVHSDMNHLFALMRMCRKNRVEPLIHMFTDGRDTPEKSALKYLRILNKNIKKHGGSIATVIGRYYSMDRDNRWDRTKKAYDAIAFAKGRKAQSAEKAIRQAYASDENDEFIKPCVISGYSGVNNNDVLMNFDYRTDRERQLTRAFVQKSFNHFKQTKNKVAFICMTRYFKTLQKGIAFEQPKINNGLGNIISKKGLKQLRIAESEKYAHVTYFFNGQVEKPNKGEHRIIVPSPRVSTYDKKPEMSAEEVTRKLLPLVKSKKYGLIILNFANGDMVGHTGKLKAAIKGLEFIDKKLRQLVSLGIENRYNIIVTADHGNCDDMTGKFKTSHTFNPVPFVVIGSSKNSKKIKKIRKVRNGVLGDVAPTILELMEIKKPKEMTGKSLIT